MASAHTYTAEFNALSDHLSQMALLVHRLLDLAIANLDERSVDNAEQMRDTLENLRALDASTEKQVTLFLSHRAPMGEDLRRVTTTLRMTSELGRMGELAVHIGRRSLGLEGYKAKKSVKRLKKMAELVTAMYAQAEKLLSNYQEPAHEALFEQDAEVNSRYQDLSSDIQEIMAEKPGKIEQCTHLLFIAKHLENLGDRAKELAQAARFIATGDITPPDSQTQSASAL